MSGWRRIVRGMLGLGLTFSAGVGVVASVLAGVAWVVTGGAVGVEVFRVAVASAIWAFPIGAAFSGIVALTARGRSFDNLSLPRFAAIGAGAGLLAYGALAANAWSAWSVDAAIVNAVLLVLLGSGAATGSLLIARKAAPELEQPEETPRLETG